MGKTKGLKYYIISGLNIHDNNRGTGALGCGVFSFLKQHHNPNNLIACKIMLYKNPWKFKFRKRRKEIITIAEDKFELYYLYVLYYDYWIFNKISILSKLTRTNCLLKKVGFVAAVNGGDGFSDIYGTETFKNRLFDAQLAIKEQIPLIILPQTLGPFKDAENLKVATRILKYASKVYVRDEKFVPELNAMEVEYKLTKDLSYFMQPEKIDVDIASNAVGLNVSGLCYSNKFRDLSGKFEHYPLLIEKIIEYFQKNSIPLYLIAHSYNYKTPEYANDDMEAIKEVYNKLENKTNVYLIDKDLTSPQTKYVISQFKFFIGTRMHSNFAAIYTDTPVFGLAYSYKYEGSFDYMGLKGHYASVLNIRKMDIPQVISQIEGKYQESIN